MPQKCYCICKQLSEAQRQTRHTWKFNKYLNCFWISFDNDSLYVVTHKSFLDLPDAIKFPREYWLCSGVKQWRVIIYLHGMNYLLNSVSSFFWCLRPTTILLKLVFQSLLALNLKAPANSCFFLDMPSVFTFHDCTHIDPLTWQNNSPVINKSLRLHKYLHPYYFTCSLQ